MNIKIDVSFKDLSKQLFNDIENACVESLTETSEYLLRQANLTVPYDTGELKRSGKASVDRSSKEGYVSYDTDYAVRVHESTGRRYRQKGINVSNPRVTRRRRAHWLRLTMQEKQKNIYDRIGRTFKRYL